MSRCDKIIEFIHWYNGDRRDHTDEMINRFRSDSESSKLARARAIAYFTSWLTGWVLIMILGLFGWRHYFNSDKKYDACTLNNTYTQCKCWISGICD